MNQPYNLMPKTTCSRVHIYIPPQPLVMLLRRGRGGVCSRPIERCYPRNLSTNHVSAHPRSINEEEQAHDIDRSMSRVYETKTPWSLLAASTFLVVSLVALHHKTNKAQSSPRHKSHRQ
jgi:hypothetical protein